MLEPPCLISEMEGRRGPFVVPGRVRLLTSAAIDRILADTGVKPSERARKRAAQAGKLRYLSGPEDGMQLAQDVLSEYKIRKPSFLMTIIPCQTIQGSKDITCMQWRVDAGHGSKHM